MVSPSPLSSALPPSTSTDVFLKGYRQLGSAQPREDFKLHIKSKLGGEFRRFTIGFSGDDKPCYNIFITRLFCLHALDTPELQEGITVEYADAADGSHLPICSDDTLRAAVDGRPALLRVFLQRRGESAEHQHGYGMTTQMLRSAAKRPLISCPSDFRRVSAIVDADRLPITLRRVQLCKYKSNLPLGFFIRDGTSYRLGYPHYGIFISRLLDHGIAASTNLLHPNDEILEVNGIDVTGKTLDQVTDIMISNSFNLYLTILPALPSLAFEYNGFSPYGVNARQRYEAGLESYLTMQTGYGTMSSRGSSGENLSPSLYTPPFGRPRSMNVPSPSQGHPSPALAIPPPPIMNPHPIFIPSMRNVALPAYGYDPKSFSRNTTVRLSDKIRNEKEIQMRSRRPFSLYSPNV